jgi:hypothetical protein
MSETDQFWQYAKEALLSACYAKTDEDKRDMLDLARTWTEAALQQRKCFSRSHPLVDRNSPAEFTERNRPLSG